MPQVEAFIAAAGRCKKENLRDAVIAARAAQAPQKEFKKIMKELV